jgi:hypothetical protein
MIAIEPRAKRFRCIGWLGAFLARTEQFADSSGSTKASKQEHCPNSQGRMSDPLMVDPPQASHSTQVQRRLPHFQRDLPSLTSVLDSFQVFLVHGVVIFVDFSGANLEAEQRGRNVPGER